MYKLKALTIKYCIPYKNPEGNWGGEKYVYNIMYKAVCKNAR